MSDGARPVPLTPWGLVNPNASDVQATEMRDRILDAAGERFAAQGISATTMGQVAADAGISRAWLYRNFPSRDAIVRTLLLRESERFAAGLVQGDRPDRPAEQTITAAFIHIVQYLRRHPLLQRILVTDREAVTPFLTTEAGPVLRLAVDATRTYLTRRAALSARDSAIAAETIVRVLISIATTPTAAVDFDDPRALRAYAARVIPPLLARR
ncbi:MAG: TetR/AcrR family transcriptional regulator [Acidimicrobiales bacterium]